MGTTISINHTILGQSLMNQTFKTKMPYYVTQFMNFGVYESKLYFKQDVLNHTKQTMLYPGTLFTISNVEQCNNTLYLHMTIENYPTVIMTIKPFQFKPFQILTDDIDVDVPMMINNQLINTI
jgi:hypothetical protein